MDFAGFVEASKVEGGGEGGIFGGPFGAVLEGEVFFVDLRHSRAGEFGDDALGGLPFSRADTQLSEGIQAETCGGADDPKF